MQKITLQQIFDLAWQRFVVEYAPLVIDRFGICSYLTADGESCGVGLAVTQHPPPTGFGTWMNVRMSFSRLVEKYPDIFDDSIHNILCIYDQPDLNNFQDMIHDHCEDNHDVNGNFRSRLYPDCVDGNHLLSYEARIFNYLKTARIYNLTIPE